MGHFLNNHAKITNANLLCNSDSFVTIESITNIIYYNIFTFKIRGKARCVIVAHSIGNEIFTLASHHLEHFLSDCT